MKPLPTRQEIFEVRLLAACGLFGPATVARLTGVPLRDVFRIEKSLRKEVKQQPFC